MNGTEIRDNDLIHIDVCIGRLSNAHKTLRDVQRHAGHPLVGPAFQYALVEYCTTFSGSKVAGERPRKLDIRMVPLELRVLHNRILTARHQLLAHADLSILEGTVEFRLYEGRPATTTTLNHLDPLEELQNLGSILQLIEQVHLNLFVERRRLLASLFTVRQEALD